MLRISFNKDKRTLPNNSTSIIRRGWKAFVIIVCAKFLTDYTTNNGPYYDLDTNYLHWTSVLPSISICPLPASIKKNKKFVMNLVRPKAGSYCRGCGKSDKYPTSGYSQMVSKVLSPCRELFANCYWNTAEFDCCTRFKTLRTKDGMCYSVNSEMTEQSEKFVVSFFTKFADIDLELRNQVQVFLHDPRDVNFLSGWREVRAVGPGGRLEVVYSSREVRADDTARRLSPGVRGCLLSSERPLLLYREYSASACTTQCRAEQQAALCNCSHHLLPRHASVAECDMNGLRCLDKISQDRPQCDCPEVCEGIEPSIVASRFSKVDGNTARVRLTLSSPPSEILTLKARNSILDTIELRTESKWEVVIPRRVTREGEFLSHDLEEHYDPGDEIPPIHYRLPLDGVSRHLELWPNHALIAPGAVFETWTNDKPDSGDPLRNIRLRRMSNKRCYYRGKVRGEQDAKLALSACDGLAGFIRIKGNTYLLEPVRNYKREAGTEHPHTVYRAGGEGLGDCGVCGRRVRPARHCEATTPLAAGSTSNYSLSPASHRVTDPSKPLFLETLLVLDKSMVDNHKNINLEDYALTVFNMAYNLFHDSSLERLVDLELVRIIRLDQDHDNMNLAKSKSPEDVLDAFAAWQKNINPLDDNHPNHHDIALLLTRTGSTDIANNIVGMAKQSGVCDLRNQAAVCQDSGLRVGYIMTHEIAHALGIEHDKGAKLGSCEATFPDGSSTIMNPRISTLMKGWSPCSRDSLARFIKHYGSCLEDEPADHNFNIPQVLPGVMYGADFQCQQLLSPNARECFIGSTCRSLNCEVEDYPCMKTGVPPAIGTKCGERKWCFMKECVERGERPEAVDGSWGDWGKWSECTRTCSSGVSTSRRECDSPQPRHGGKDCVGKRRRHRICNTQPCAIGSLPFRDVQCAEFNDWIFPEDGKVHQWKGAYIEEENPCVLFCVNENNVVASLRPKVIDGTTCYRAIRDICIGGTCKGIPCDLQLDSNAVEDVCGICHGNGAECKLVSGIKDINITGLESRIRIPTGARNVRIEEARPTKSQFIIKSSDETVIYNEKKKLGLFELNGTQAWVGMIKPLQESLNIPGPVKEELVIQVNAVEPVEVKYSMGVPCEEREPHYTWDYLDWTRCSAQCGPGTELAIPKCIELFGGLVEDKYCKDIDKIPEKSRSCNLGPCTPRWLIGDWQECGPCPSNKAKHFRAVNCVVPLGEGEGESNFIDDSSCIGEKPITEEQCDCRSKRQIHYHLLPSPVLNRTGFNPQVFADFMQPKSHVVDQFNKQFLPLTQKPEAKITLMQLENESEESMLKQYKENELKKNLPLVILKGKPQFPHDFKGLHDTFNLLGKKLNMQLPTITTPGIHYFFKRASNKSVLFPQDFGGNHSWFLEDQIFAPPGFLGGNNTVLSTNYKDFNSKTSNKSIPKIDLDLTTYLKHNDEQLSSSKILNHSTKYSSRKNIETEKRKINSNDTLLIKLLSDNLRVGKLKSTQQNENYNTNSEYSRKIENMPMSPVKPEKMMDVMKQLLGSYSLIKDPIDISCSSQDMEKDNLHRDYLVKKFHDTVKKYRIGSSPFEPQFINSYSSQLIQLMIDLLNQEVRNKYRYANKMPHALNNMEFNMLQRNFENFQQPNILLPTWGLKSLGIDHGATHKLLEQYPERGFGSKSTPKVGYQYERLGDPVNLFHLVPQELKMVEKNLETSPYEKRIISHILKNKLLPQLDSSSQKVSQITQNKNELMSADLHSPICNTSGVHLPSKSTTAKINNNLATDEKQNMAEYKQNQNKMKTLNLKSNCSDISLSQLNKEDIIKKLCNEILRCLKQDKIKSLNFPTNINCNLTSDSLHHIFKRNIEDTNEFPIPSTMDDDEDEPDIKKRHPKHKSSHKRLKEKKHVKFDESTSSPIFNDESGDISMKHLKSLADKITKKMKELFSYVDQNRAETDDIEQTPVSVIENKSDHEAFFDQVSRIPVTVSVQKPQATDKSHSILEEEFPMCVGSDGYKGNESSKTDNTRKLNSKSGQQNRKSTLHKESRVSKGSIKFHTATNKTEIYGFAKKSKNINSSTEYLNGNIDILPLGNTFEIISQIVKPLQKNLKPKKGHQYIPGNEEIECDPFSYGDRIFPSHPVHNNRLLNHNLPIREKKQIRASELLPEREIDEKLDHVFSKLKRVKIDPFSNNWEGSKSPESNENRLITEMVVHPKNVELVKIIGRLKHQGGNSIQKRTLFNDSDLIQPKIVMFHDGDEVYPFQLLEEPYMESSEREQGNKYYRETVASLDGGSSHNISTVIDKDNVDDFQLEIIVPKRGMFYKNPPLPPSLENLLNKSSQSNILLKGKQAIELRKKLLLKNNV